MSEPVSVSPVVPAEVIEAVAEALLTAWNANDNEPERFEARHSATVALEVAAPFIAAAERERIKGLAAENGASYWRKVMSGDDPPQQYVAEFPFEDLLRAEA